MPVKAAKRQAGFTRGGAWPHTDEVALPIARLNNSGRFLLLMFSLLDIPRSPGCYIYKNEKGQIIYVGKAKDLRKRVSSYFQKTQLDTKTSALVSQIAEVSFIATSNEVEALILENNLIKKPQPHYNIDLKDSRRYAYLSLTDEEFPRLILSRKRGSKGAYFGPFVSAAERDYVHETVNKAFQLRTCSRLPKKACLRYHMGMCSAPCEGLASKEQYEEQVRRAKMVLSGKSEQLASKLQEEMNASSGKQAYEQALVLRNQIKALDKLAIKQNMERQKVYDEDVLSYIVRDSQVHLLLFSVKEGVLLSKQEFSFPFSKGFFEEFLVQYYAEHPIPKEVIVPKAADAAVAEYLSKLAGKKVLVAVPQRGEKRQLLELASKNLELTFFGDESKMKALADKLRLHTMPKVIECFDISHLSGTSTVGSMVQFRNAKPDKSNYRRFRIRTVVGIDDFRSIAEVVRRRYSRLKAEGAAMPDLIIVDGGKGQLSSALLVLQELELKVPIVSLAKREEEIFVPGLAIPIRLSRKDKALQLVQEIRDEAHRFAIAYNRLLRGKRMREKE